MFDLKVKIRMTWRAHTAIAGISLVLLLTYRLGRREHGGREVVSNTARAANTAVTARRPLERDDADRDGLPDSLEAELAARYAPAIILAPQERNRPASIDWLLARIAPTNLGVDVARELLAGRFDFGRKDFPDEVRAGSGDSRDWVTYVHVYPRADGGINLQYWFFYPYNDGPLFFDHEGDWEHVTVELDHAAAPRAVDFSQHANNDPGVYRDWSAVRKLGDHPIVLSARGTHASYPDQASTAWFETVSRCRGIDGCPDPVWRTWEAGGLANLGERDAVTRTCETLTYRGRWGGDGRFLRSRPAPRGPFQQRGFSCAAAR
jgi:hypothetical protein